MCNSWRKQHSTETPERTNRADSPVYDFWGRGNDSMSSELSSLAPSSVSSNNDSWLSNNEGGCRKFCRRSSLTNNANNGSGSGNRIIRKKSEMRRRATIDNAPPPRIKPQPLQPQPKEFNLRASLTRLNSLDSFQPKAQSWAKANFTNEQRVQIVQCDVELREKLAAEVSKSKVVTAAGYNAVYQKFLTSDAVERRLKIHEEMINGSHEVEDGGSERKFKRRSSLLEEGRQDSFFPQCLLPKPTHGLSSQVSSENEQNEKAKCNIAPRKSINPTQLQKQLTSEEQEELQSFLLKCETDECENLKMSNANLKDLGRICNGSEYKRQLSNNSIMTSFVYENGELDDDCNGDDCGWLPWPKRRGSLESTRSCGRGKEQ